MLAVPVVAFALWERAGGSPTVALTAAVLVSATVAQLSGGLEPAMFLVSLLVVAVAGWEDSSWRAGACCLAAAATPPLCAALQPADDRIAWGIWVVGVAFPALISRGVYRQVQLTGQLLMARGQLDLRAQAEERRRIARDVHDLVGHGLSGVLLQVAGARHVLRRDPDAAEQALAVAEEVGRRSMHELRATVAMLRGADDIATHVPLPDLAGLGALVDAARRDGLTVELRSAGALEAVDPAVGLALFRIAQEALVNAARHAPRAATVVATTVTGETVALEVDSRGPLTTPTDRDRPRYGLIGMRERGHRRRRAGGGADRGGLARPLPGSGERAVIRVVVDDQEIVRTGLARIFSPADGFEVVAECADGAAALVAIAETRPGLVLMDVRMPELDGIEATRRLRADPGAPPVLVLTTFDEDELLWGAIEAGAAGFVLKDAGAAELLAAGRAVAAGGAWFDAAVAPRVLGAYRSAVSPARREAAKLEELTDREHDVLRLLARGLANGEIAGTLHVSEATVKSHVGAIFSKLGVRDRAAAIVFAFDHGVVDPGRG